MVRDTLSREAVLDAFPWAIQSGQKMVVGTDLDALLSSVLAHHLFGWEIAGYYDLRTIWRRRDVDQAQLREAVWLDLDICRPNLKSIGHHILTINGQTPAPPQHARTLNPNLLRCVGMNPVTSWRRKYPLGTVHFLLWLWNASLPPHHQGSALPLVWLADSAYINAQSGTPAKDQRPPIRRYRANVLDWAQNVVPSPVLTASLDEVDTDHFESRIERLRPVLEGCGWVWGEGNIRSRHRDLSGGQCRFTRPDSRRLNALYEVISRITGWRAPRCPDAFDPLVGRRTHATLAEVSGATRNEDLARFLAAQNVFSYALPFRGQINYTRFAAAAAAQTGNGRRHG